MSFPSATAIVRAVLERRLDASAAVRDSRARIEALDDRVNAFTALCEDPFDPAGSTGPLAGVPIAVKDVFVDRGRAPTAGSQVAAGWLDGTAEVIARIRAAGAHVVGYTNLHEWMWGTTSTISAAGPVHNPWDTTLVAGGSSGGSAAAVASGMVPVAIGSDAGGSIRVPSASCGLVGLKPTHGAVSLSGFVADGSAIDHAGPIARSVEDVRVVFEVLTGRRVDDADAANVRVGVARPVFFEDIDPAVDRVVSDATDALRKVVADVREVEIAGAAAARYALPLLFLTFMADLLRSEIADRLDEFEPQTQQVFSLAAAMTDQDRRAGEAGRAETIAGWDAVFREVDVVLTPTLPTPPPKVANPVVALPSGESGADIPNVALNGPMNLGGVPALTLPCGELGGTTTGMTLTAARGREDLVLAVGAAFERATGNAFVNRVAPLT